MSPELHAASVRPRALEDTLLVARFDPCAGRDDEHDAENGRRSTFLSRQPLFPTIGSPRELRLLLSAESRE